MQTRVIILLLSIFMSVVFITVCSLTVPSGFSADFLFDRNTRIAPYPFTIQNIMWVVFFIGIGELFYRNKRAEDELCQTYKALLPEDEKTLLRQEDLPVIYRRIRDSDSRKQFFLQRLIGRCVLQFQNSKSIDHANSLFNSSLELYQHEIELRYNMLRYVVWLIPTLGFIGTVVGIALALNDAGAAKDFQDPTLLKLLTKSLGVAFYTTMLALLMSAILMYALHVIQGKEETALNRIGQYCLDNFLNRLYEK